MRRISHDEHERRVWDGAVVASVAAALFVATFGVEYLADEFFKEHLYEMQVTRVGLLSVLAVAALSGLTARSRCENTGV